VRRTPVATPYAVSLVWPELLTRVGFTDHAIERFATRAGLATTIRRVVEPIIRELLLQEGLVVAERPHWARSRNAADLYLQLGEWMLFIGRGETRQAPPYAIVTVVNGPESTTWPEAVRRGYIFTRPPPLVVDGRRRHPSSLLGAIVSLRNRRANRGGEGIVSLIRRTQHARGELTEADYERAIALLGAGDRRWTRDRRRARQQHLARYGFD
jgi:hypothetical protein